MKRTALDPSKRLDLYLRINRIATKTFTMVDDNGSAYSLIYEDFQVIIKRYPGDKKNTIFLEIGSGLSITNGNELTIEISASQSNVMPGEYYWELYKNDDEQTWLSGKVFFHEGEFDGVSNEATTLTIEEDATIQIIVNI